MELELSSSLIRRGLRSRLLMSCSWDRAAGDEGVQVFLLRFQDADDRDARHTPPPKRRPGPVGDVRQ